MPPTSENPWQVKSLKPKLKLFSAPLRPADIVASLCEITTTRQNLVEDVNYRKTVPNHFVVELAEENYQRNYRQIENQVCQQWRERLLTHLTNTNSRQGRQEYRFAGPVLVELRPASDLTADQARIYFRLEANSLQPPGPKILSACLETTKGDRRWPLREGIMTLGREAFSDIVLDLPLVQEKKLVSGQHAYLRCLNGEYRLFDGTPRGQASTNGTFVNALRVPAPGILLKSGDILVLASLNPTTPILDTPGIVVLRFRTDCT